MLTVFTSQSPIIGGDCLAKAPPNFDQKKGGRLFASKMVQAMKHYAVVH